MVVNRYYFMSLFISSPAFENNGIIPSKFTCDGDDINPEISIDKAPQGTKSLALIMDDPDAPRGTFDHWIVYDIPVGRIITQNSVPGVQGKNSIGQNNYTGPCPPGGTHHYYFKVYALDTLLELKEGADKTTVEKAMDGHILSSGELIGLYKRK